MLIHFTFLNSGSFTASSIYSLYFVWPGSNALRLGKVEAVRLLYERSGVFDETELIVQRVLVQQARYSANPTKYTNYICDVMILYF